MRETRADTAQAFVLAVLLHVALFALLFVGLWWTRSATPAAAGAISAELMDASQLSAAMRRTLRQEPVPLPVTRFQAVEQDGIVDGDGRLGGERRCRLKIGRMDRTIGEQVIDRQDADNPPSRLQRNAGIGVDPTHPRKVQEARRPGHRLQVFGQEVGDLPQCHLHDGLFCL